MPNPGRIHADDSGAKFLCDICHLPMDECQCYEESDVPLGAEDVDAD